MSAETRDLGPGSFGVYHRLTHPLEGISRNIPLSVGGARRTAAAPAHARRVDAVARFTPLSGVWTGVIDLILALAFALLSRINEALTLTGVIVAWWPFALGAAFGWVASYALRIPVGSIAGGLLTALGAILIGLGLRAISGQDVALGFTIIVSVVFVISFLGWRIIATIVVRRRRGVGQRSLNNRDS